MDVEGGGRAVSEAAAALLAWYDRVKRDLPWRKTTDPYRILVSEVMLQQTQVKTVLDYYGRFLERFPDVYALAAAGEDEVLEAWKGLGYYRRARNLHSCAKRIVDELGGRVPRTYESLRRLPGVGEYTAAAVASIAFGEAKGVVDGNVLRVMARLLGVEDPIDDGKTKRAIQEAVDAMICRDRPGDFNQALMELGATVCTPTGPRCDACPLRQACRALSQGSPQRLPVRRRKQTVSLSRRLVAVVERAGRVLVMKRPADGLLGGMWEFLNLTRSDGDEEDAVARLLRDVRALARGEAHSWRLAGRVVHRFSHLEWEIDVYYVRLQAAGVAEARPVPETDGPLESKNALEIRWVKPQRLSEYALPRVMQKVWETVAGDAREPLVTGPEVWDQEPRETG